MLEFAAKIMQNSEAQRTPAFPGNRPYREYGGVPAWYYGTYKEPIISVGESGEKL